MEPGQTLDRPTARLLTGLCEVMEADHPDMVVVLRDGGGRLPPVFRSLPLEEWTGKVVLDTRGILSDQRRATAGEALRLAN
ncbi:hypothetical protein U1701_10720 [Sphingomonas sp. PB2P19]|uniref:hypothetical protein n=1 Tax=Sphingomonas rhamnosi TaxID=3096156 RepID=UPI002FC89BFE